MVKNLPGATKLVVNKFVNKPYITVYYTEERLRPETGKLQDFMFTHKFNKKVFSKLTHEELHGFMAMALESRYQQLTRKDS